MSYPINYPTPQGANVQTFIGTSNLSAQVQYTWIKPQGASFVFFLLIGGGGAGGTTDGSAATGGGGSGAVTTCMVPAFLIPDQLTMWPDTGANQAGSTGGSYIYYKNYQLLQAVTGSTGDLNTGGLGGVASTSNNFSCMGFFQSVAGQDGANPGNSITPSATTFLSGGGQTGSGTANYGYSTNTASSTNGGFLLTRPILVGVPNMGNTSNAATRSGIGCGGAGVSSSGAYGSDGGVGMIVVITW
jgi:hypothetical protein